MVAALAWSMGATAFAQQTYQGGDAPPPQDQPGAAQQDTEAATDRAQPRQGKPTQIQADGVRLSQLDQQQISALQQALQQAGYYTAAIDGIVGPQTRRALRQFYTDQARLASQGMILPQAAAALGLDEAEMERVRGEDRGQPMEEQPMRSPGTEAADDTMDPAQPPGPAPAPGAPTTPHGGHDMNLPGGMPPGGAGPTGSGTGNSP
jgi:hypothetical protein